MVDSLYNSSRETKSIWVFLEHSDRGFETVSLELLSKGRELVDQVGWSLSGLLIGHRLGTLSEEALAHGADQIYHVDHPLLNDFSIEGYSEAAYQALMAEKPSVFLLGATPNGRDLAGRLAVRLRTGLNADCTQLYIDPEREVLVCEVSGFGGGVLALIEMQSHRPQMATVRAGVFAPREPDHLRTGEIIQFDCDLDPTKIRTRTIQRVTGEQADLARAPVLVAGGRGIDGEFAMLEDLADLLGGEVGATRPPVDEGYIERERQIGQTGVVCSPKIAICCGISGAFHFLVGVEKAETVIAINSDPEAPIFEHADYCIVGDAHKIVPALVKVLKEEASVIQIE